MVADLCVVGGYAQYAIRPARFLVPVPDGVDPAEAVCIPLAYLTAYQMLTRYRRLPRGATILVIGASGTVGTALLDLARHLGLKAIGTCSATNVAMVERFGATAIDYRAGDFVAAVRGLTAGRKREELASMQPSMRLAARISRGLSLASHPAAYSSATVPRQWRLAAQAWCQRHSCSAAVTPYSIASPHAERRTRRISKADMAILFDLLRDRAIHPVVIDRLALAAAREVHTRIDLGGLGGKIVLLPWPEA